ncbi:single Ig IL-1-related receptor [Erpetoichthys calabaricus]|uniref:Single immunoglobulin and toll-interleukin 1 receptor (TIR) domain n=1 Tax=Erpetoichthys calabaricus TaxID=27687 RepID=A0A8C4TIZ4_ERPCA|nr:single Ig IL-1-related receptor [Erpetoichthys calabaricus]XP_028650032.1 single Ig IL-1-related receptor [Erpetoichthys calabaricus]
MSTVDCSHHPTFLSPIGQPVLEPHLGEQLQLNCSVKINSTLESLCNFTINWFKDGLAIPTSSSVSIQKMSETFEVMQSVLSVNMTDDQTYGVFKCVLSDSTAEFTLQKPGNANHVAAVIGALTVLVVLVLMTIIYVKCRLNVKLWCRDKYEDYDANDGKLFDAYISYMDSASEKKFVNFILKPHLENKYNYKLHLNTGDILPGSEPSAELLMNVSRCRRLIVVLSQSYLEQDWCTNNFKEGLWRLTELCNKPIFILFENQYRLATHPAVQLLREQKRSITLLVWNSKSVTPSSDFWKELVLAMPHKIRYHSTMADPQVFLHDDKDPMLTVNPEYLDCGSDLDPQGDLGVRVPIFKGPPPKVSALPNSATHVPTEELEQRHSEIDISDLGSRNYGVRTDFYCLVTEEEF